MALKFDGLKIGVDGPFVHAQSWFLPANSLHVAPCTEWNAKP